MPAPTVQTSTAWTSTSNSGSHGSPNSQFMSAPSPHPIIDSPHSRGSNGEGSTKHERRITPTPPNNNDILPPSPAMIPVDNTSVAPAGAVSPRSWLSRVFGKGKKDADVPVRSAAMTASAAAGDDYRSVFAQGADFRPEQDVISLDRNILHPDTSAGDQNGEIIYDYESMVAHVVHSAGKDQHLTYGQREQTVRQVEQEQEQDSMATAYFQNRPVERKFDDDTRLMIKSYPSQQQYTTHEQRQRTSTGASSKQVQERYVPVEISARGSPSHDPTPWTETDVSQASPVTIRPQRATSREIKNRKVLRAVMPTPPMRGRTVSRTQQAQHSQPLQPLPLPAAKINNRSNIQQPQQTQQQQPPKDTIRKSVGFVTTDQIKALRRNSDVNIDNRRRASSVDGGMDDHYDEIFDDVLADDADEYFDEDPDHSEDASMVDISDDGDDDPEWDQENFAQQEAKAQQVLFAQKMKQERDVQSLRQTEYNHATKLWL